ncbi:MAG TPA: DUF6677 family protein, partial [Bryobacteraceae bacterium]|nr:DUF6677 family protein [Bryobacteraceae bacterium]
MAEKSLKGAEAPLVPVRNWIPVVALGWLVPGAGHLLLRRTNRGALVMLSVAAMFVLGLMMRGAMFYPQNGDLLTMVIYYGGFVGNLASGVLYFLATA